jgi:hypothetical protein
MTKNPTQKSGRAAAGILRQLPARLSVHFLLCKAFFILFPF